jgi:hypothetical protein
MHDVPQLFLLDVDNMSYDIGLSENAKARMEEAGRVALSAEDTSFLATMKATHLPIVVIALLAGPYGKTVFSPMAAAILTFWIGGIGSILMAPVPDKPKALLWTVVQAAIGTILFPIFMFSGR